MDANRPLWLRRICALGLLALALGLAGCASVGVFSPHARTDEGYLYETQVEPLAGNDARLTVWAPLGLGQEQLGPALQKLARDEAARRGCTSWTTSNQVGGLYNTLWRARRYVAADLRCTIILPPPPVPILPLPEVVVTEPLPVVVTPAPAAKAVKPATKTVRKKPVRKKKAPACVCPPPARTGK